MDARTETAADDPIVVSGIGVAPLPGASAERLDAATVQPWLKSPKTFKFMGKQDCLAVVAAGRALTQANLMQDEPVRRGLGVYLCVGYIPFEQAEVEAIVAPSVVDGQFSMAQFSTVGLDRANPLLTFRCLPNMPIFHISLNFQIQGAYQIGYPGPGQFYQLLEEALRAVAAGAVPAALVGGVADQNNFLVRHHFARLPGWPTDAVPQDGAGFVCIERLSRALARGAQPHWVCRDLSLEYTAESAYGAARYSEDLTCDGKVPAAGVDGTSPRLYRGPGGLITHMAEVGATVKTARHAVQTWDGFRCESQWERPR